MARPAAAALVVVALASAPVLVGSGCRKQAQDPGGGKAASGRLPRIDVHVHMGPDGIERARELMTKWGIDGFVNLSGMYPGPPRYMLETQLEAASRLGGRVAVFANVDFVRAVRLHKDYGQYLADQLDLAKQKGAIGLKISKGLGLGYPAPDLKRPLPVDDPGLDKLFDKAGALGMPVAIHTGDPQAFWKPPTPANERYDELNAHPDWSFHNHQAQGLPSWEELYAAFERRVARHPKTTFIGVHFGNAPEEPDRVARMLDKYPNLYIDTAARVPEIGRHDAAKMRRFFEKYQDRVLFGTDTGIGWQPGRDDVRVERRQSPHLGGRAALLHRHLALLRDRRQAVRAPHPHPGPLENRRSGPARGDFAQALLRQRRPGSGLEAHP